MKVLILADMHYDNGKQHLHYPASEQVLSKYWEWLKNEALGYDLIALCGDISVKGTAHISELEFVKEKMDSLGIPYIPVPGNHDLCATKGMEDRYPDLEVYEYVSLEKTNYYKVFGQPGIRYSRKFNNISFIGFAIRNGDPDGQLPWLAKQLEKPGKKIVFGHFPLVPSRSAGFCLDWDYSRIKDSLNQLIELLGNKKHGVLAYFCGHQHINSIVPLGDTLQIETASCVLGTTSYRIMDIDDSLIRIFTKRLPFMKGYAGDLVLPKRSFDDNHKNADEYHFGNDKDRCLNIKL